MIHERVDKLDFNKIKNFKPGMMSTYLQSQHLRLRQEDCEFEASLDYVVSSRPKKRKIKKTCAL
jgi:hypothetical protein